MWMLPAVGSSSPAISRSSVDLPQPEGPTKTTNSPSSMSRLIFGMMTVAPKDLLTSRSWMVPTSGVSLLHGAEGQAADELLLAEPAHDQDRRDRHHRRRRELRPEQAL